MGITLHLVSGVSLDFASFCCVAFSSGFYCCRCCWRCFVVCSDVWKPPPTLSCELLLSVVIH